MKINTIRRPGEPNNTYRIYPGRGFVDFWYNPGIGLWEIRAFSEHEICQKADTRKRQKDARMLAISWAAEQQQ